MEIRKEDKEHKGYPGKREEERHWQEILLKTESLVKIMNLFSKIWCFFFQTHLNAWDFCWVIMLERIEEGSQGHRGCVQGADDNCSPWNLNPC